MPLVPLSPGTRNLIDGQLVDGGDGATFANLNPATEEVLGVTADGTRADMERAIAAARRAFDTTGWSQDAAFRARCLQQLHDALAAEREQLRAIVVAEAAAPVSTTTFMQVDDPIAMLRYWADTAARYRQSGVGRENGAVGFAEYLETKVIALPG